MTESKASASNSPQTKKSALGKIFSFFKWSALTCLIGIVLIAALGVGFYIYISKDLPNISKVEDYQPPVMAEVFDDQGQKVGEFWTEARILTPIDQIPQKLINAFVASEDDRFFEHQGVDPYGIVRAFFTNLKAGGVKQGASTITQQLTKALLLSPERSYERKIKEAILATRIEQNLSKEQILYVYLNQIYFGNRAYGVAAAARNYFHKDLKNLSLAEMAMIAGLPKAPSSFNPVVNPKRAQERMNYVLDRMAEEGYISTNEAKQAKQDKLFVYKAKTDKEFNYQYAPYFVEEVRRHLVKKYGTDKLYTSGWKIYTTLNLKMYQEAQKAVTNGLKLFTKTFGYKGPEAKLAGQEAIQDFLWETHIKLLDEAGAINYYDDPGLKKAQTANTPLKTDTVYSAVITDAAKNDLQVQVGTQAGILPAKSWSWAKRPARKQKPWRPAVGDVIEVKLKASADDKKAKAESTLATTPVFELHYAPEVQSALFSYEPFSGAVKAVIGGQDFKKSEFNRATQALLQPGSVIKPLIYAAALDKGYSPGTVIMDSPISYEESPGKFWTPKNYGGKYYGPTAFRHALVNSRNVVSVRILMDIGTHYAAGFIRKLGLETPIYKYYSMALGANEVKLAELARAYGSFVTGGVRPNTYYVEKIVAPQGEIIEEHKNPQVDYVISYQDVKNKEANTDNDNQAPKQSAKKTKTEDENESEVSERDLNENSENSSYNTVLLEAGEEFISKDDLLLTAYEKEILYGDYIPKGYTLSPKTAVTMVNILRDVVRAGTGARARALEKPAGGKTGTTNDSTDTWFMGFTPTLVTGVWVGFDEERRSLGRGRTGSNTALPIWLAYMKEATQNYPTKSFTIPKWVDLSVYEAPIGQLATGGDAELGDIGVGTGVNAGPSGPSPSSAEFFAQDLE